MKTYIALTVREPRAAQVCGYLFRRLIMMGGAVNYPITLRAYTQMPG